MANSDEWTEWHLTPHGWMPGCEKYDPEQFIIRSTPIDRVLSCKYAEYIPARSMFKTRGIRELWHCSNQQAIAELLEEFGPCPRFLWRRSQQACEALLRTSLYCEERRDGGA